MLTKFYLKMFLIGGGVLPLFINSDEKHSAGSDVHHFSSQSYMFKVVLFKNILLLTENIKIGFLKTNLPRDV